MIKFKFQIPNFIREDFPRKFIACFFACLIWFFVNRHISEVEIFRNIKVDVIPQNTSQVIVSPYKPEIALEIRGPRKILNNLESKDIEVTINLDELLRPGSNELRILEEHIKLPNGLRIESIMTKTITVAIDTMEEREVDVAVIYTNRLSEMYELQDEPIVKPERITIKGPSKKLDTIQKIETRSVYIDPSRTSDFSVTTKVAIPEGVTIDYDNVTAYIKLKKRVDFKSLPVQNVFPLYTSNNDNPQITKAVGQAFAYVSGPPSILEKLDLEKDVRLFIEINDSATKSYEIKFWCKDPNVSLIKITPSRLTLDNL